MSSEDDLDGRMGDEQGIDVGKVGKVDGRIKGRQVGLERINVASYSSAHQHPSSCLISTIQSWTFGTKQIKTSEA